VLAGSVGLLESVPSIGDVGERFRQRLIENGVMRLEGQSSLVFSKDYLFSSPSAAALALLARRANGWREWKNAQGRTLSEVKR